MPMVVSGLVVGFSTAGVLVDFGCEVGGLIPRTLVDLQCKKGEIIPKLGVLGVDTSEGLIVLEPLVYEEDG
ncbi:unnamed protein product [Prorocentrum cordatum]|uniref:Uncharacterized protein n=1 Tax=Prorocentrum cordatum TaxID=2364126 RepID=A0ABN9Q1L7_9DINO|nr:unnamed protein product [Polarella glacialis]